MEYQAGWIFTRGAASFPTDCGGLGEPQIAQGLICRSSLSAEAQIMTTAVDNLEWAKTMFGLMLCPSEGADSEHVMKWLGGSPCIKDARVPFSMQAHRQHPA